MVDDGIVESGACVKETSLEKRRVMVAFFMSSVFDPN